MKTWDLLRYTDYLSLHYLAWLTGTQLGGQGSTLLLSSQYFAPSLPLFLDNYGAPLCTMDHIKIIFLLSDLNWVWPHCGHPVFRTHVSISRRLLVSETLYHLSFLSYAFATTLQSKFWITDSDFDKFYCTYRPRHLTWVSQLYIKWFGIKDKERSVRAN